jgi:acetyl/propionyl-CoA carboxylase alpha subunit/acetyl-CoA carboxylase carboxyltransferase component
VNPDFRRIAIVNRGEAALRLIRAVRELERDEGTPLEVIALYTDPDRRALYVREADHAVCLGSAIFVDPRDGSRKNRYLDHAALEAALRQSGAEAAWVGWGFVSEHAGFAELCRRLGVVFIGPDPEVMRALGDKIGSKRVAERAGVPVAPWSGGPVASLAEAREQAERLGFPLMIKATAGGGGRGIRRVRSAAELAEAFESARSEALKGFGDDTVFAERLVEGARHVEVQILGDGQGTTWALGVRDCTVQRRNQKVIEESPSPGLSARQERQLCDAAARLGSQVGYRGAGTVEFLYEPRSRSFSFMEVNARLQVEHPVTECVFGVDLVKLQIHVARGRKLDGAAPTPRGHAVEVRLNAEDPERGFSPAPGLIELFRMPGGPGVRVDTGFAEGSRIAPEFDSMLAKIIAHGRDREEAFSRLRRALAETGVAIRGGASNKGFLLGLLDRPEVRSGEVDVDWLDRLAARGEHLPRAGLDVALLQGAIDAYEEDLAVEQAHFFATAARGRMQVHRDLGCEVELRARGARYALHVRRVGPEAYRIEVGGLCLSARAERLARHERALHVGGRRFRVLSHGDGIERLVEVDGVPHCLSRDDAGVVRAPAPAVVLQIAVAEGDEVRGGERLGVLEAMKSELPLLAPCDGKVRQVLVKANVQVEAGAPLLVLEPVQREEAAESVERVRFDELSAAAGSARDARMRCRETLEALRCMVLGFDVGPDEARALLETKGAICRDLAPDDPELLRGEDEILAVFADVWALFAGRTSGDIETEARSAEEYLLLYLRSLDPAAAGLSPTFTDQLQRTLRHYGISELRRTPELEESLLWIGKAHERRAEQVGIVLRILERRLDHSDELASCTGEALRGLLDRIVAVTRGRHQAVSDLAREVRYRYFDRLFFDAVQAGVYREAEEHLRLLSGAPAGDPDPSWRMEALVECPEPLVAVLTPRLPHATPAERRVMLEVLTRRYYRIRELREVETRELEGRSYLSARYAHEGRGIRLVTTHATQGDLEAAVRGAIPLFGEASAEEETALDVFLSRDEAHRAPEEAAAALRESLGRVEFGRPVRRIVVAVASAGRHPGMRSMQHFTFRKPDGEIHEDRIYRGLHPMMSKRLQIWRLANFEIERVPSSEDVYLFHGVARSNPRDERLFAFAEIRDLTPLRDEGGRVVRLPRLEMMVQEAAAAMRLFQTRRGVHQRLEWNRLILYVWPPLELSVEELNEAAHQLLPAIEDLGLQKVVVRARVPDPETGELRDTVIHAASPGGRQVALHFTAPADEPITPLSEYGRKVVTMRQRGLVHPFELVRMLSPPRDRTRTALPPGDFVEYDLDDAGRLRPVERAPGRNEAKLVVGRVRNFTAKHPEGMTRIALLSDPSREMASFAEPECRRIVAALDLAEEMRVPVEWFAISAGAKIAMDSGTENLDWTALALRRIVQFTQAGGEINVIVAGINVGGQSYWNAEATMLMHCRGVLIMTPQGSMVLTGKKALDYSGGVSAEDHQGIGGFDRIMGVNGEAQCWAGDLAEACRVLMRYYEHTYVAPDERFPRRATSDDPVDRDVRPYPYGAGEAGFETLGEIFSEERNPGRRRPFEIRRVMRAVVDQDQVPLERWGAMREAEMAVVWEAHLGGWPVCLIGIESRPVPRLGFVPADGPDQWTAGTLFPLSSKKVARALNAASGNRPVVVLANLSGFDGSPESLRRLQLEYGAEIGRAVVNFRGPIVFCVISRYHGGAYVVFSRSLNEHIEVAALEGSYASVIGGAPAAAVVFSGEVDRRARADARLQSLEVEIAAADEATRGRLRARWHELYDVVHSEKLGEVARHFDSVHDVYRAQRVGSLHHVLPAARLRPYLVEAVERGMRRAS